MKRSDKCDVHHVVFVIGVIEGNTVGVSVDGVPLLEAFPEGRQVSLRYSNTSSSQILPLLLLLLLT